MFTGTVTVGKFIVKTSWDDKGLRVGLTHGGPALWQTHPASFVSIKYAAWDFPDGPGKDSASQAWDVGSVPGWELRSHIVWDS